MVTEKQIQEMRDKGFLHGEAMKCGHCDKLIAYINDLLEDLTAQLY